MSGTSRREFLQWMAASTALATLGGCRRGDHRILAYHKKPPEEIPGVPLFYATTLPFAGRPVGVLAETHEGRPTKLEGNPLHPLSGGSLPAQVQASILDLYDPDRSRAVRHRGAPARWKEDFVPALRAQAANGEGLAILTGDHASPAAGMLLEEIARVRPRATLHAWEPLDPYRHAVAEPELDRCDVILALDADPLGLEDDGTRLRRAFAARREPPRMNRLYAVEPHFTATGMAADHRLCVPAGRVREVALALAHALGLDLSPASTNGLPAAWIAAAAADLKASGGRCVVLAGRRQPPFVHALARWMNRSLGAPVRWRAPDPRPRSLVDLAERLRANEVRTLLIWGANPVYDAPADLEFARLLAGVETSIHLGPYPDETGVACVWHVPEAHPLERWGDALAGDVLSPVQPLIAPLLHGRSPLELLALLAGRPDPDPYGIVRESFLRLTGEQDFEARWRRYLHQGVARVAVDRTEPPEVTPDELRALAARRPPADADGPFEICFAADESVLDGRLANNGWLQECPDPVTKLTWDNAAVLAPATARTLGVANGDLLEIRAGAARVEIPALVVPGVAAGTLQLPLGYGRTHAGRLGRHAGRDVYPLRDAVHPGFRAGVRARRIEGHHALAFTQERWTEAEHALVAGALRERGIVREATLARFLAEPDFAAHEGPHLPEGPDLAARPPFTGDHQWGMVVDLGRCLGCTACTLACQAENNIPLVGRDEVRRGREMHWMRLDRYFFGEDPDGEVRVAHQPMACQHCENAPCEPVCPVNATVHDGEGLNVMVYNRCVGTRYCSNNCPYKVRRFNFYDYNKGTLRASDAPFDGDFEPDPRRGLSAPQFDQPPPDELEKLGKNPDVTVRMRGVMEKCTFCLQRIRRAEIARKVEAGQSRPAPVADGTLLTACQQACPTGAIVFGDLADPASRVARLKRDPRRYDVLAHLNTRPRTSYLARVRNPNPALEKGRKG